MNNNNEFKIRAMNMKARHKNHVDNMSAGLIAYYSDPDKKNRTKVKGLCKYCHYVGTGRIGGAAMTRQKCATCDKDELYSSTCTDVLCLDCALVLKYCKHCGQKMD